jgi:signal transduction histidine kinase/CheY-like chemotaxis protein
MEMKVKKEGHKGNGGNLKDERNKIVLKKERQVLLIIEDKEVCSKLEDTIRDKFAFEVETVKTGNEALEKIKISPWQYDVAVIYDDFTEKSSGLELLKKIKKQYPEIEVIYIINSDKRDTDDAWNEDASNCFITPINFKGIAYAVKFAREQSQFRRERKMLEKLQELSLAINSAIELPEIQNLACQAAVEILCVEHSALVLFEKDLSEGTVIAEYPEPQEFIGTDIKVKGIPLEEKLVYKQELINIPDLANCKNLGEVQELLMKLQVRSLLIVPVILNNKVIASFSIDMTEKNRVFYPDEEDVCKKLANQLAVAIGKDRYLRELSVLNEVSMDISTSMTFDIEEIFALVRKHAGKLIDAKNFFVALWDEEKKQYSVSNHIDEQDYITSFPPEKQLRSLTDYVRRSQKPILADSDRILELRDQGEIDFISKLAKVWLGVPIISRNKVYGVLVVQDYENENTYDDHDLTVLQTIASQLAIAIKNLEFTEKIARARAAEAAIISAQYVSGMIHELASSAHKGKGAITYIRGTPEYKKVKSQNWKIEFSKMESAFDDIGEFTTKALDFRNIAQMKFESTLEYRSINKAIQDVLHDINNEVRKKSANIKWEWDKNHNQKHAYFDEILIKQAIRNLVSNSLRWISDGGRITISSSQKEDYISILVEDNGPGVEPGTENKIFEPYFTTSPQGYGIGLFFVKNVVKLHKGSVNLVSARQPTTFEIKISSKLKKGGEKDETLHS